MDSFNQPTKQSVRAEWPWGNFASCRRAAPRRASSRSLSLRIPDGSLWNDNHGQIPTERLMRTQVRASPRGRFPASRRMLQVTFCSRKGKETRFRYSESAVLWRFRRAPRNRRRVVAASRSKSTPLQQQTPVQSSC